MITYIPRLKEIVSGAQSFLGRLWKGEDVVLVPQSKEAWEHQFRMGTWDDLKAGAPHTLELARLVLALTGERGVRLRVLDIGCGNGGLARLLVPHADYTGIDISETAVAMARQLVPGGRYLVARAEHLPREQEIGQFDAFVFNESIYYMEPSVVLAHCRAHTAPGAMVFISIFRSWRSPFLWRRVRKYLALVDKYSITASGGTHRVWDVAVGRFRTDKVS